MACCSHGRPDQSRVVEHAVRQQDQFQDGEEIEMEDVSGEVEKDEESPGAATLGLVVDLEEEPSEVTWEGRPVPNIGKNNIIATNNIHERTGSQNFSKFNKFRINCAATFAFQYSAVFDDSKTDRISRDVPNSF